LILLGDDASDEIAFVNFGDIIVNESLCLVLNLNILPVERHLTDTHYFIKIDRPLVKVNLSWLIRAVHCPHKVKAIAGGVRRRERHFNQFVTLAGMGDSARILIVYRFLARGRRI
jgi:hypothetical protein